MTNIAINLSRLDLPAAAVPQLLVPRVGLVLYWPLTHDKTGAVTNYDIAAILAIDDHEATDEFTASCSMIAFNYNGQIKNVFTVEAQELMDATILGELSLPFMFEPDWYETSQRCKIGWEEIKVGGAPTERKKPKKGKSRR